jgi:glutaredoxin
MITVYYTPDCVFCHALMAWLEKKGIEFEEKDLSDKKIRAKLEKQYDREFTSVPLTIIGDEIIEGFNRPAIKRALKKL